MFPELTKLVLEVPVDRDGKECIVRLAWPTDEQWIDRARRRKIVQRTSTRGESEVEESPHLRDVDLEIARACCRGGDEFDAAEAALAIAAIAQAVVTDVAKSSGAVTVAIDTVAGETVHELRKPSAKQGQEYGASVARVVDLPHGRQQITLNLRAAAELYDNLEIAITGYEGTVPIIHKHAVVGAVMAAVRPAVRVVTDPN